MDFVVTEYQTYEHELFHTVQLPCIETLIRSAVSLAGGIEKLPLLTQVSAQVDTTLGITDVGIALKEGRKKDGVRQASHQRADSTVSRQKLRRKTRYRTKPVCP